MHSATTFSLPCVTYASPQPWRPSSVSTRQNSRSFELLVPRMKVSIRAIFMGCLPAASTPRKELWTAVSRESSHGGRYVKRHPTFLRPGVHGMKTFVRCGHLFTGREDE